MLPLHFTSVMITDHSSHVRASPLIHMHDKMAGKRPHEGSGLGGDAKRVRSNDGSPALAESEAERRKREAQERMAAVKARLAASKQRSVLPKTKSPACAPAPVPATVPAASGSGPQNDVEAKKAEAQRKIAAMKAKMAAQREKGASSTPNAPNGASSAPPSMSDKDRRISEARARADASARRIEASRAPPDTAPQQRQEGKSARGGLGVGLHPSLMRDTAPVGSGKGKGAPGPKFSTTRGNQQPSAPKANPYLDVGNDADALKFEQSMYDPAVQTRRGGDRKSKALAFNPKGKFMAMGRALREKVELEKLNAQHAADIRKAQIEEAGDKAYLVPEPPDVEWWDEGLLPEGQGTYEDCLEEGRNRIGVEHSIISAFIQHPVILEAPQDKFMPEPKPLMLTTKEAKKLRRQRRMADRKEEQAKIRLGLVEPPPPKVKKSNMMRVLGEQAVKDPTAVEARVNREIAQRKVDHERANEDRKLTKEQREEKLKRQQAGDEARGIKICVFRVDNLSSGKNRYQVDVNAKQNALTGIVVLNPKMNLVIVEGGEHSIKIYKKLMLSRVKWSENTLPLSNTQPSTFTGQAASSLATADGATKAAMWCNPLDDNGVLKDLGENRCVLVWEGEQQARSFRKWGSRACETDSEARDVLSRQKMENMWTLAQSR